MAYRILILALAASCCVAVGGCMRAAQHQQSLGSANEQAMTLGVVQKEIKVGMSQADVVEALGSPNMVTKDANDKETWVYDKIATEASYSRDSGGTGLLLALVGGYGREAGAASSTQRTLTVVIKFNPDGKVESTSYHATKF